MIGELGQFALVLALLVALVQASLPLVGAQRVDVRLMAVARPAALLQFALVALSFGMLTIGFIENDFSLKYVAQHSNTELPLHYRISAVWGAHEGSLLLWMLILAGWSAAVALRCGRLPITLTSRVLAVLAIISIGFLLFILLTSNPFERLVPAAFEGNDLNPLLQDFGLIIHPPMLYMGYVGFSVAFAFAVAALLEGRLDTAWARWTRPWTLVAWLFLTLGIMLGSWWAYYELGWGGWWFWDPVENASFMPWLVGTALIHSLALTEKRGLFKSWTVLLAISAFSMSLLGTFLVRSGVLVSVHAFASDPERGVFILAFLAIVVAGSLTLFAINGHKLIGVGGRFHLWSREGLMLVNNAIFALASALVLFGTLAPLIYSVLDWGKISIGPPYFNAMFAPLMLGMALVLAIGPLMRWGQGGERLQTRLIRVALAGAVIAVSVSVIAVGDLRFILLAGLLPAGWVAATALLPLVERYRRRGLAAGSGFSRSQWGMTIAHFGVSVFIIGVTLTSAYSMDKELRVKPGETVTVEGLQFRFHEVLTVPGPNYLAQVGYVRVYDESGLVAELRPEKRTYRASGSTMTEAGIEAGFWGDLYVSLGEPLDEQGAWGVRFYVKPMIRWIWGGAILMALGGLLAASDRRYRVTSKAPKKPTKAASSAVAGKSVVAAKLTEA